MKRRWNGSVQSTNTPTYNQTGTRREDYGFYRCMVTKIYYTDDPQNISKNAQNPEVLYDCVILGGSMQGQLISFARMGAWLGGDANYAERILTPASKSISGNRLSQMDGDIVFVQFIQGHDGYPVIVSLGKGISNKKAAKKADGPRTLEEYNGLIREINNKGEYIVTRMGGKTDSATGKFKAGTEVQAKVSFVDGKMVITDNGTTLTIDKAGESYTRVFKSGLSVTEDGKGDKIEMKTAGGTAVTIDGKGNKVSIKAGSAEVLIDGGSGKISIKGDMIDLGSSVSDFVTKFTELASAFASHTHMVPQAPAGLLPSQPPMAPLLSTVGSQTVKVQS